MQERTDNDYELILRIRRGDEKSFALIYYRYHKLLYVVAYNYLKSHFMAEDAVQHVFLKLWEMRSMLAHDVNLKNYLFTMMKNHVLNEIRNNNTAVEKNYELSRSQSESENMIIEMLEEKESMEQLYSAIDRLPEQKKQVCLLKLQGDLSNQEIACRMNISVPTVKAHYMQAIKALRTILWKQMSVWTLILLIIKMS